MAGLLTSTMEAVRRAVERPQSRGLAAFLTWWREGLAIDLPPRLVRILFGDRSVVKVVSRDGRLEIYHLPSPPRSSADGSPIAVLGDDRTEDLPRNLLSIGRRRPVVLELPAERVLVKRQDLPRAAAAVLDQTVRYGLSQWTPFDAEEVYWTAAVVSTTATQAVCEVRLVPRPAVAPLLERLRDAGLPADGLQLGSGQRHLRLVDERKHARARHWRQVDIGIAAVALLLLAANAFAAWQDAAAENAALSEALRERVEHRREETRLDEAIRVVMAREQRILGRRTETMPLVETLATIGRTLPSEAEVSEVAWDPARVRVVVVAPTGAPFKPEIDVGGVLATDRLRSLSDMMDGRQQYEWILEPSEGGR